MLPLFLLVISGIVDFGLLFQRYHVNNAAREGARIAVLPGYGLPTCRTGSLCSSVREPIHQPYRRHSRRYRSIRRDPTPPFPAAQVTVTMAHNYLVYWAGLGLFGGGSFSTITLTARSTMRYRMCGKSVFLGGER